ncbi:hypothetical protein EMCG_02138 [[Emmonsia] crescens]|uniref:Uncharacterized protein n=1 Tax=[Emmonsia] crescens TaxID=73230 RepID=A0A0G2HZL2_9EURO|nr:hypothetical protein EMCG_02138 [Emmonsia crescens UAMH 3008]
MKDVNDRYESCGYAKFMNDALQFPPTGKLPTAPNGSECIGAPFPRAGQTTTSTEPMCRKPSTPCPTNYMVCSGQYEFFPGDDKSSPSGLGPLPNVIEKTNNTIIGHGALDFLLF